MEYSNDQISHIIDDTAYLIDEAEALKYVIDSIPVTEKPAGSDSILEMIWKIDYAQQNYFRPLVEQIFAKPDADVTRPDFRETFNADEDINSDNIVFILRQITKNRASFMTFIRKMPVHELRRTGKVNGTEKSIAGLLDDMVKFERKQLKKVAERVLSIDKTSSGKQ